MNRLYAYGLAALAVVAIIGLAYTHYQGLINDKVELTSQVNDLNSKLDTAKERERGYQATITGITVGMGQLRDELQAARATVDEARRLFGDHDFDELARKKPGLITIRMQRATTKVFSEIEEEANE